MLVIGAKGLAKEVLDIFHQLNEIDSIAFYDDVNADIGDLLFNNLPILKSEQQGLDFFYKHGFEFTLGLGNPHLRHKLFKKFEHLGGILCSSVSPLARVGHYGNSIGIGCNILPNAVITNGVEIGMAALINISSTISHDVIIGKFVEICPGVNITGNCSIGSYTFIGTNSTILPGIKIGQNVIVGAGSVVTKDIPNNCLALGTPARIIKELDPVSY